MKQFKDLYGLYFDDSEFAHVGRSKRDGAKVGSGRYPLGSGKNPNQHDKSTKTNSGAPDWFHKMYTRDKEGTIKLVDKVRSDSWYLKELDSEYNGYLLDYMFENVGNADSWFGVDYGAYKIKEQISKMNEDSDKAIKSKQISRKNMDELLDKQGDVISENGHIKGLKDSFLNEKLVKEFENPQYEVIRSVLYENDLIDFKKSIIPTTITYDDGWNDLRSVLILKNSDNKENFDKTVSKVANTMKREGYVLVDEDPHPKDNTDIYYIYGHDHKNKKLIQVFVGKQEIPSTITDPLKQETIKTLNQYMIDQNVKHNLSGPLYNMYFGSYEEDMDIAHVGRSKRDGAKVGSGRYPLGSGKEPYQHDKSYKFKKTRTTVDGIPLKSVMSLHEAKKVMPEDTYNLYKKIVDYNNEFGVTRKGLNVQVYGREINNKDNGKKYLYTQLTVRRPAKEQLLLPFNKEETTKYEQKIIDMIKNSNFKIDYIDREGKNNKISIVSAYNGKDQIFDVVFDNKDNISNRYIIAPLKTANKVGVVGVKY